MTVLSLFRTTLYFLGTVLLGVFIFTYGFFPLTHQSEEFSSSKDVPIFLDDILLNNVNYKSHTSKVIFMVIDALRYDFISHMPNTKGYQQAKKSYTFKLKVEMPTVTLPRIKSITTGSISNFIDVIINLGCSQLLTDSIVYQMYKRGDKINFYGDVTWTNLFPNMFFRKQKNFDSYYLNDFYESDNNITKNLSHDLVNLNWDFMILHYVGLDHIGHIEGSRSLKIYDKLIEMDTIIQHMYKSLFQKYINNTSTDNIIFVTGDHGMRDTGSHGGGSEAEIFVPLIMFRDNCDNMKQIDYNQIDIAPTLAILLGIPIPATSIGKIIPDIINFLSHEDQLNSLYYNTKHLVLKAENCLSKEQQQKFLDWYESAKIFHKAYIKSLVKKQPSIYLFENAKGQYVKTSDCISNFLISAYTKFDLQYIFLGILLSTFGTISLLIIVFLKKSNVSDGADQNCYLSIVAIVFISIACALQLEIGTNWHFISIMIIGTFISYTIKKNYGSYSSVLQIKKILKSSNYFVASYTFAVLSLISSSFIEEEHQLWYYFGMTIFIYLAQKEIVEILLKVEFQVGNYCRFNLLKKEIVGEIAGVIAKWMMLFLLHAFIRRLNQTGDKWSHLDDIGDWLLLEKHKSHLCIIFLSGLLMSAIILKNYNNLITNFLCCAVIILISQYRCATGDVDFLYIKEIKSNIALFVFWFNILAILVINYVLVLHKMFSNSKDLFKQTKNIMSTNLTVFVLISIFLHKPYNIILVPSCIGTMKIILLSCDKYWKGVERIMAKTILTVSIGKMFFFYQGNSNSFATIDLNSGYLFIHKYNAFIVGICLTLNTYSGPLCCLLVLVRELSKDDEVKQMRIRLHFIFRLVTLMITFRLNFYMIVLYLFRHHLFIWTVFSPKFMYELYDFLLFIFIVIFYVIYFTIFKVFR